MLEIRLLGQFDVRRDGAPVAIPSRPAQSLLAYLVLHPGQAHRREMLAGLLWPDASEANARNYLRKALWQVRKSLGGAAEAGCLLVDDLSIAFDAARGCWLNAAALDAGEAPDRPVDDLIAAVALYRGELLPGFYDEWVALERERLRAAFERRMVVLLDRLGAEARWAQVLEWGEQWIALGGAPEPAYRALMAALAALGDMAKVAAVYERCVQALRADLGVAPSAQTRQLYERLAKGEGIPGPPPPVGRPAAGPEAAPANNLPIALTSFIGREREIALVQRLLAEARLVTLTGAGGSGKTRLAIEVARVQAAAFADGVCLAELGALADPALVPQAAAAALGVPERPSQTRLETLTNHLHPLHLLLVLDSCEHLIEACARFAEALVGACPRLAVLATSREALGVAGERVFQVPNLSLPAPGLALQTEVLMQSEGVRLFVERAAAVQDGFRVTGQNAAAVADVCRRLDGIPLAIELAAARVRLLTLNQIAARLNDRFQLLAGGSRTALPRYQTLRAALDWSHDLLSQAERVLLRRLSVFAGGWTLEAAEAVCSGAEIRAGDVLDLLAQLANKSLVLAARQLGMEVRYHMLETVREYARERLAAAGEAEAVRDRHLEFFVQFAEMAEPRFYGAEQEAFLDHLDRDVDNLRQALDRALRQQPATDALRLVGALGWFWDVRSQREALQRSQQVVSAPGAQQRTPARARALNAAGHIHWVHGQPAAARALLQEALAIGRETASRLNVACSLQFLGLVATFEGEYDAAESYFAEGLAIGEELGVADTYAIGEALSFRGDAAFKRGDYERARRLYSEGVARLYELGDKFFRTYPLRRLGQLALLQGDLEEAAAFCKESLALNIQLTDERGIAACFVGLAGVALAGGLPARAVRLLGAAEAHVQALSITLSQIDQTEYERHLSGARAHLDDASFAAAWAAGRAMTLEQAAAHALAAQAA